MEDEIHRLESQGSLELINYSEWVAPIVVVPKRDGRYRFCGDRFQKVMDSILQGIPGVLCYIDDILVTGSADTEHLQNLEQVFTRLQEHNVRVNLSKCHFMKEYVEYLGHVIVAAGIHTSQSNVKAVLNTPKPRNIKELRSFLGLINYYRKFLPNLATIIEPLNSLLRGNQKWVWTPSCTQAFETAKNLLTSTPVHIMILTYS